MMYTKRKWTFVAGAIATVMMLSGCGGGVSDEKFIVLNLEAAIDSPRTFDLGDIAEKVDFIPLDDSDERGLVGSIRSMAESRDGFYICEGFATPVQHFDRTGKLVSTIGRIGRGPDELSYIANMAVDYDTGKVFINGLFVIATFDATGRMTARNDSVRGSQTVWRDGELLSLAHLSLLDPKAYSGERVEVLRRFSQDLKRTGTVEGPNLGPVDYFFTDRRSGAAGTGSVAFLSDNGENLIVRQSRNDTLYYYNGGTLGPAMVLNLGRYALPAEGYGIDPAVEWSDNFYSADNLWEGSRYIVVSADNYRRRPTGERIPGRRLIFDRNNLSVGGFSATGPDGTPGLFLDGVAFAMCYIRDNRLVGYMQALDIVDAAESGSLTRPDLTALAATIKEDSNPVIVVAELKK